MRNTWREIRSKGDVEKDETLKKTNIRDRVRRDWVGTEMLRDVQVYLS